MDRTSLRIVAVLVAFGTAHMSAQAPSRAAAKLPPLTRSRLTTIQGNALNSTNGALPDTIVRLRDARLGRIVDSQVSDKSGLFVFKNVDPGNYIVEMLGHDQTVLAASQILSVNAGEAASAVVKLPFSVPMFAGVLGNSTSSAAAVTAEAAASSILAVTATAESSNAVSQTAAPATK
jgi:hypothetical protein